MLNNYYRVAIDYVLIYPIVKFVWLLVCFLLSFLNEDLFKFSNQAESKREIQKLENRCKRLESGSVSSIGVVEALEPELLNEPQSSLDDSILIVGGFDGFSWLSDLDSYSPALDLMKSLRPMTFVRSYASVAKLDGELYIFGGVDGNSWYNIGIGCNVFFFFFFFF